METKYPGFIEVPDTTEEREKVLGDIGEAYQAPDYDDPNEWEATVGNITQKKYSLGDDGLSFEEVKPKPVKKKPSEKRVVEDSDTDVTYTPTKRIAQEDVCFKGMFGEIQAKYLNVYIEDKYLILVSDIDAGFNFIPPMSEEPFTILVNDVEYKAISINMSFPLEEQGVKVLLLLLAE